MFSRLVGKVDGPSGHATRRAMKGGVGVTGLEHIPVRQDIQVGSQQSIVSVDEDVPWVRRRDFWKEICKYRMLVRIGL